MLGPKCILLFGLILTLFLDPISGRKGFSGGRSHSYPKSGGLSGGGGHGYPSSGGLSGSSGSHGYPSGGLSGGGRGYPSSGGSHGYPSSGGMSGGSHGYPSSGGKSGGAHGYPASGGLSGGGSGYPSSNGKYPAHSGQYPSHTSTYKNYQYSPPQQINYVPRGGGPPQHYPVYQGAPPTYVYQYKDSGSKYGTLLAGLALLNLGTLAGTAYAIHKSSSSSSSSGGSGYTPQNGEICKFAIKKDNGDYEETRIDCNIISSFILQDLQERSNAQNVTNTVVSTTVTNVTMVNLTGGVPDVVTIPPTSTLPPNVQVLLPNGTLIDMSQIHNIPGVVLPPGYTNTTQNETAAGAQNSTVISSVTTTTNTTVVNALDVKGKPVDVTPGMECFVISTSPMRSMKKHVPCGLLQTYAEKSIRTKSSAVQNAPMLSLVAAIVAVCLVY